MKLEVASHEPTTQSHKLPLLFVHGMWHAAWCWNEHFLPFFAEHGYSSHALSLRGHGASEGRQRLRWTRLADFVADLAQVTEQLNSPPVLIGHSMGGMVVQKFLESRQMPAAVLLASAPPRGVVPATLRLAQRHPLVFLKVNLTLSLIHTVGTPELYRDAYFSDSLPQAQLVSYHSRLQDESFRAYVDMMFLDLPHPEKVTTPVLVLGASDDNLFAPSEVESTAEAYNTRAEFFPGMGHAMMLDVGRKAVAEKILEWLDGQGL